MAKRLEYEIGVDSSKGVSGLKAFSSAAKKELKAISDGLDDTSTNAEKVAKVLADMAGKIETEMKEAATAAEALGKALGPEVAGRADLDSIVSDLNKMGLTFDEITADADKLATSLKELDRVGQAGLGGNLPNAARAAKGGVDELRGSADQSRSVLANMVGNSAQDLGALGGVAGSTGVLLGQLGEYAADGNLKLAQLGKLALPMAGLAAGFALVSQHLASIARTDAFNKERVVDFTEAMEDATVTAQELQDVLASEEDPQSLIANIGSDMVDVENSVASVLGTFDEFRRIVRGGEDAVNDWITDQLAAASAAGATEAELRDLNDALVTGLTTNKVNAAVGRAINKGYREQVETAFALGQATRQQGDAADEAARDNAFYGESLHDVEAASEAAASSIPGVGRVFTDLSKDAIQAAEDAREFATSIAEAQLSLNDMATSFSEMARRDTAIQSAFDLGDAPFEAQKNMSDFNVALEELAAFVREHGPPIRDGLADLTEIDFAGGEVHVAPFLAKIEALKGPIQQKVGDVFATSGSEAANATAAGLIGALVEALDGAMSAEELDKLIFGPDGHTAVINIAVEQSSLAKAQAMIQLLTGIPGADPLWLAQVALDLQADKITPEGVQTLVAEQLQGAGVNVPTELLPADATSKANAKTDADNFYRRNPALMGTKLQEPSNKNQVWNDTQKKLFLLPPLQLKTALKIPGVGGVFNLDAGGTAGMGGGIAGEGAGPEILNGRYLTAGPTYVPPGTRVTSTRQTARILKARGTRGLKRYDSGGVVGGPRVLNINVNTAVIGNRYDLMRQVERAGRDKIRLLGTRS